MTKFIVEDIEKVRMATKYFLTQKKGVIFLANKYAIGVDIKCGDDAAVFVYMDKNNKVPEREQCMQMMGRGQRSRGVYNGIVFTVALEEMAETLTEKMKEYQNFTFEDGATNLRAMVEMKKKLEEKQYKKVTYNYAAFLKAVSEVWLESRDVFVKRAPTVYKEPLMQVFKSMKPYQKKNRN